jgi:hypothetical protein
MTQNQALHSHHASTRTTEGKEHNFSGDVLKGKANKFIYMSVIYKEILLQTGREIELNTDNIINLSELRIMQQACSLNKSPADRILVAKPLGKQPFERQRGKWKDNSNTISEVFE